MDIILFPVITKKDKELPFYIKSIGQFDNQHYMLRKMGTGDYHYIHTYKGSGKLIIQNKEFILSKNSGFISNPNIPHEYYSLKEPWGTKWFTFDGYAVDNLMKTIYKDWKVFDLKSRSLLEQYLDDLYILVSSNNKLNSNYCSSKLYSFLMRLKDDLQTTKLEINSVENDKLSPVYAYMEEYFSNDISLDDLAKSINVSPQHLCRLFKKSYHMRPFEYLTQLRINKAKEILLNNNSISIKDVSKNVGFRNSNYFCHKFNQIQKCTPLQFRNQYFK